MNKLIKSIVMLCLLFVFGGVLILSTSMLASCANKAPLSPTTSNTVVKAADVPVTCFAPCGTGAIIPCNCGYSNSECIGPLICTTLTPVPPVPTATPTISNTPTGTITPPTATPTATVPTNTPTPTVPTATPTITWTPSFTPSPIFTQTPVFTPTPDLEACIGCVDSYDQTLLNDLQGDTIVLGSLTGLCGIDCIPFNVLGPEAYFACVGICVTDASLDVGTLFLAEQGVARLDLIQCREKYNCP